MRTELPPESKRPKLERTTGSDPNVRHYALSGFNFTKSKDSSDKKKKTRNKYHSDKTWIFNHISLLHRKLSKGSANGFVALHFGPKFMSFQSINLMHSRTTKSKTVIITSTSGSN